MHIMKKVLKVIISIVVIAVVLVVTILLVSKNALDSAAKLQTYDFGDNDKIPSLTSVVGARKVAGVSSGSSTNGVREKSYTYETETLNEDLDAFVASLQTNSFLITKSLDGNALKGSIQLGINSIDEGKIILVDLSWDNTRIVVQMTKGDGTITPN